MRVEGFDLGGEQGERIVLWRFLGILGYVWINCASWSREVYRYEGEIIVALV